MKVPLRILASSLGRSHLSAFVALGALGLAVSLTACGGTEEPESLPAASEVETTTQHLDIFQSYPPDMSRSWYADMYEDFTVDVPEIRIHYNGSVGKGRVDVWATAYDQDGRVIDQLIRANLYIGDGTSIYLSKEYGRGLSIPHMVPDPSRCWKVLFGAKGYGLFAAEATYTQNYCWDPQRGWRPGIDNLPYTSGYSDGRSMYIKKNWDFSVTFNWFTNWKRTFANARFAADQSWHAYRLEMGMAPFKTLLVPIYSGTAVSVADNREHPISQTTWDYSETTHFPTFNTYDNVAVTKQAGTIVDYEFYAAPESGDFGERAGTWTPWLNRDRPSGNGDGEHLAAFIQEGYHVCPKPLDIQCRRVSDGVPWYSTGETYTCLESAGGNCDNAKQSDGMCDEYEVRFFCPYGY